MGEKVTLRVWRGDAGQGQLTEYQVEANEGEVVLDILHRLQATQAGDLAVRWNCKAGKCGSCSMEINGRPRLACMTRMSTFEPAKPITLPPIRPGEFRMQQEDVQRSQEFGKCIECFLCQYVCHGFRDHPDNETAFAGP